MSASWGSSLRVRARGLHRWALIAVALVGVAGAAAAARRDSVRVVKSITMDESGVHVRNGKSDHALGSIDVKIDSDPTHPRVRIRRGAGDSSWAGGHVRVVGPGVVVNAGDAGLVRVFADAEVPAGERLEGDVVAVFGSAMVDGSVSGDVVAVFGSVRLGPAATVDGNVVAIGGVLDQPKGATVGGESVSLGFFPIAWGIPTVPVLLLGVLIGWLLSLFVAWLASLLFRERLLRVAVTASRRATASFFLGLVSAPLMLIAAMLLFITVIGMPLSFALPLLYAVGGWVGQIAATMTLGSRLLRRRLGQGGPMMPILAGSLFVASFFAVSAVLAVPPGFSRTAALFFFLLGMLLLFCLSTIGTGAILLSRMGGRPTDVTFEPAAGPTPLPGIPSGAALSPPGA